MTITFTKNETAKAEALARKITVLTDEENDLSGINLLKNLQDAEKTTNAIKVTVNEENGSITMDIDENFISDVYDLYTPFVMKFITIGKTVVDLFISTTSAFNEKLSEINQRWMKQPEKEDESEEEEAE